MDDGDQQDTSRRAYGDGIAPRRPSSPVQPDARHLLPLDPPLKDNEPRPSTSRANRSSRRGFTRSVSSASSNAGYHTPLPHRHGSSTSPNPTSVKSPSVVERPPTVNYIHVSISPRHPDRYPAIHFTVREDHIPYIRDVSSRLHGFFLDCMNADTHAQFTEDTLLRARMLELVIRRGLRIPVDHIESPYVDFKRQVALAEILWRYGGDATVFRPFVRISQTRHERPGECQREWILVSFIFRVPDVFSTCARRFLFEGCSCAHSPYGPCQSSVQLPGTLEGMSAY